MTTSSSLDRRTRAYRAGTLVDQGFPAERISEFMDGDDATAVWIDLDAGDDEGLEVVANELGLHPLALEDALHFRQRPKIDYYDDHLFMSVYEIELDDTTGTLVTAELNAFITPRALVTVHQAGHFHIDRVVERWDQRTTNAHQGVAFLLHGLLDYVVDGHFTATQSLDDAIEGLEDSLFDPRPRDQEVQRRSFQLRKSLVALRRVVLPMREVVNSLIRRETGIVTAPMLPYYQDVYDHVLRVTEWTESLRDLVQSILETNLSVQSNHLNEVMKKLTSWAAIIAVPTAITGFFGQNVPYPGFNEHAGFVASSAAMTVLVVVLWITFRVRRWL